MKPHSQLLLLGLINVILNLTSVSTQDNVFISWAHSYADFHNTSNCWVCGAMPLSVMDGLPWWVSLLRQGDFKPFCSFLERQKETLLSLVHHNLSLLSWCKPDLQSIDLGHGVTFDVNTSFIGVTKAYTSYLKNKRKKAPWPAREDRPLVMLNNSTKSGMNISGWPRKGSINYSHHYMLGTKRTKGRVWSPSIRPKRTKIYGVPIHQTM